MNLALPDKVLQVRKRLCELLRTPSDAQLRRLLRSNLAPELSAVVLEYAYEHTFLLLYRHVTSPGDTLLNLGELAACLELEVLTDRQGLWQAILGYARRVFAGLPDVEDWPVYMRPYARGLAERRKGHYSPSDWCFMDRIDCMERRQACCVHCAVSRADLRNLFEDGQEALDILTRVADIWSGSIALTHAGRSTWTEFLNPSQSMQCKFELGCTLCLIGWGQWWQFALLHFMAWTVALMWSNGVNGENGANGV